MAGMTDHAVSGRTLSPDEWEARDKAAKALLVDLPAHAGAREGLGMPHHVFLYEGVFETRP